MVGGWVVSFRNPWSLCLVYGPLFRYEVCISGCRRPKPSTSSLSDLRPPDHRFLPPTPERSGPCPLNLGNVGASIVTEFGLQVRPRTCR